MKASLVIGLLIAAITVAVTLHITVLRQDGDEQRLIFDGLRDMRDMLPYNRPVFARIVSGPNTAILFVRYALAPHHTEFLKSDDQRDSVLLISQVGDSAMSSQADRILWENHDKLFRYQLLSRR